MHHRALAGTTHDDRDTANERFKRAFQDRFWASLIAAVVVHFAVFGLWPEMTAADVGLRSDAIRTLDIPPELEIPPEPEEISRPARPVLGDVAVDEDVTIGTTDWDDVPVTELPPPPTRDDVGERSTLVPYTLRPEVLNRAEAARVLEREYPSVLRDAGIGGTVYVQFFIDEAGMVRETRLDRSSGHERLDQAALDVAEVMRFTPALNRDKKVAVWISLPITFRVR